MSILERALLYYDPYELCDLCFGIEIAMCLQSFRTGLRCLFAVQNLEKLRYLRNETVGKVSGSDCDVCRQFLIWKKWNLSTMELIKVSPYKQIAMFLQFYSEQSDVSMTFILAVPAAL